MAHVGGSNRLSKKRKILAVFIYLFIFMFSVYVYSTDGMQAQRSKGNFVEFLLRFLGFLGINRSSGLGGK